MAESKKFLIIGLIAILTYVVPWLIIGILHWIEEGFDLQDKYDLQYIINLITCGAVIATSFHLWSRVPGLEGRYRKLFLITGFTFVVLLGLFTYMLIDIALSMHGYLTVSYVINSQIPQIKFAFFNIEALTARIAADSLVTFSLLLLAISFYLYPMEKYVKQTVPWHTISMFICTALIPVLLILRDVPYSVILLSIGISIVVLWVLYNFLFLFYLYFSTGLKSPKGSALRRASFMIGIGLLLIIVTWIAGWAINTGEPVLDLVVQMSFGGLGVILFNYGFYLIRPD